MKIFQTMHNIKNDCVYVVSNMKMFDQHWTRSEIISILNDAKLLKLKSVKIEGGDVHDKKDDETLKQFGFRNVGQTLNNRTIWEFSY